MQVTDVRVRKVTKEGKMRAIVSITLDDEFVIHDIKVIEGDKGLFIAMPSKKATDGEYRDIAHPINSGTRTRSPASRTMISATAPVTMAAVHAYLMGILLTRYTRITVTAKVMMVRSISLLFRSPSMIKRNLVAISSISIPESTVALSAI